MIAIPQSGHEACHRHNERTIAHFKHRSEPKRYDQQQATFSWCTQLIVNDGSGKAAKWKRTSSQRLPSMAAEKRIVKPQAFLGIYWPSRNGTVAFLVQVRHRAHYSRGGGLRRIRV